MKLKNRKPKPVVVLLTADEHAALKRAAKSNLRSMGNEIKVRALGAESSSRKHSQTNINHA